MENRELDNWLAVHLMGSPKWEESPSSHSLHVELNYSVPKYTTSISDAFQVVEKMDNCLHLRQHGKTGGWVANFCVSTWEEVEADTASLAICLAAKKAIELDFRAKPPKEVSHDKNKTK